MVNVTLAWTNEKKIDQLRVGRGEGGNDSKRELWRPMPRHNRERQTAKGGERGVEQGWPATNPLRPNKGR